MLSSDEITEFAYQTLNHFCEIAPYSSFNLAQGLTDNPKKNIYINSHKYFNWFHHSTLKKTYKTWEKHSSQKYRSMKKEYIKLNENFPLYDYEQNFLYEYGSDLYSIIIKSKTGTCGDLASAGAYYLIEHLKFPGTVRVFTGLGRLNQDHCFIVLNCPDSIQMQDGMVSINQKELINIDQLPDDILILDLWTRCCFTPSKAKVFWSYIMDLFDLDGFLAKQVSYMDGNNHAIRCEM